LLGATTSSSSSLAAPITSAPCGWWSNSSPASSTTEPLEVRFTTAAATHPPLQLLGGHTDPFNACAFSTDGRRLLSAGAKGTLRFWDAETGETLLIHAVFGQTETAEHQGCAQRGHAVWEPACNRLIEATGDAWRRLK